MQGCSVMFILETALQVVVSYIKVDNNLVCGAESCTVLGSTYVSLGIWGKWRNCPLIVFGLVAGNWSCVTCGHEILQLWSSKISDCGMTLAMSSEGGFAFHTSGNPARSLKCRWMGYVSHRCTPRSIWAIGTCGGLQMGAAAVECLRTRKVLHSLGSLSTGMATEFCVSCTMS